MKKIHINNDDNYAYLFVGQQINVSNTIQLVPSLEPSFINRRNDWGGALGYKDNSSTHLTIAATLGVRIKITDWFSIENQVTAIPRTDLGAKYDNFQIKGSWFVGGLVKF